MTDFAPLVLSLDDDADLARLDELRREPSLIWLDTLESQRAALRELVPPPSPEVIDETPRWVYYPWRRTMVAILGPLGFRKLRLDRNRNKISESEQNRCRTLSVGVVGLSVGHAIAHTIALDGVCGRLALADFDHVELSNLNRIPASLVDLGVDKAVVAARRIAEVDPYLPVSVDNRGITDDNIDEFLEGLDVVVEECDSLDVKVRLRERARARGIPVIMETSDRGLLDVERFDLEPERPLFHGILGDIDSRSLVGLSTRDKVPYVLAILGATDLSTRIAASMIEVDRTVTTWPQLGSEVALGGATVAAAVRRLGLNASLPSGRIRVDLSDHLDALRPPSVGTTVSDERVRDPAVAGEAEVSVVEAARRAPSGGNVQPWNVSAHGGTVTITSRPDRSSGLDVGYRGSYVAVGAASFNARVAAARSGANGSMSVATPEPGVVEVSVSMQPGADERLSELYESMLARTTNRRFGTPRPLTDETLAALADAASAEGCRVRTVTDRDALEAIADVLAESDRLRYLTEHLHAEMISELRWPGDTDPDAGIDVASLAMDATDLVKLDVVRRPEVMAMLAEWDAGTALGDDTRDRVLSASAVAVVVVDGSSPADFVRGGAGVERTWIAAERAGLAVHPVSPTFIYARTPEEFATLSAPYAERLADLRTRFQTATGVQATESIALVLRLSHATRENVRSRRRKE